MMTWAKRLGLALFALILLATIAVLLAKQMGERKLQRQIAVQVAPIAITTDPARIEYGRYLFATRGCAECHGATGGGKEVINADGLLVVSPNITRGAGSAVSRYQPVDWVRVLRHGVKPSQRPVLIMPSEDYARLSDDDLSALIAYATSLPPVSGKTAIIDLPLPVMALYGAGAIDDAAGKIDHQLAPPPAIAPHVSVAYGAYVANACIGCHGPHLSGGKIPGGPPTWPAAANLTPGKGSVMPRYVKVDDFMAMLRSGRRPDGSAVSDAMPFPSLREMNDTDLRALHSYLLTLAPREAGQR